MKKFLILITLLLVTSLAGYFIFLYTSSYSEGVRSGELIKVSHKGMVFKTWEGEISQGIAGAQIFAFSVLDDQEKVIADLQEMEGNYVQLSYVERYRTFPWWGETRYFITSVKKVNSPFKIK
jgi:uncharacterized protein YxeA